MARAPDRSNAGQFNAQSYTQSWAANNPYYAPHVNYAFNTLDNTRTQAAVRSGVVHVAGYSNITPMDQGQDQKNPYNWASPIRNADTTGYDQFGNVKKQKGDINLGLVMMGGYQFPGQAFNPSRTKYGLWEANPLAKWMNAQGTGGYSPTGLRDRRVGQSQRETGWMDLLSQSISSNKGPEGKGQSSEDSTLERYSTQETRLGTRAQFTNEEFNEGTSEFGRTWAGYKPLSPHAMNPHFDSKLTQMFKTENANVGFARRASERRL